MSGIFVGQFHGLCAQIDDACDRNDLTRALELNERARLAAISFYKVRSPRPHAPRGSGQAGAPATAWAVSVLRSDIPACRPGPQSFGASSVPSGSTSPRFAGDAPRKSWLGELERTA